MITMLSIYGNSNKKETNNSKSTNIKQIVLVPSFWLGNIVVLKSKMEKAMTKIASVQDS